MKNITIVVLLLIAANAFAGTGLAFLEIPVGARENALGGAGVALITGPTSAAYNPAAIAFTGRGVAFMHSRHFGDTRVQFLGATLRLGKFALSPHFWGTRVSDIEYRETPTRAAISTFDAVNDALGGVVAWQASQNLAIGLTGRYLFQKIHMASSDGWAMDGGAFYKTPLNGLSAGLAVNHFGHVNEMVTEKTKLPTTLRAGAAFHRQLRTLGSVLVTAEEVSVRDHAPQIRGGIEYSAPNFLALRAGYVNGLEAQGLSLGFGLFYRQLHLDYAFIPFRDELGEGHRFSLGLDL
jgi:hypothetical protein